MPPIATRVCGAWYNQNMGHQLATRQLTEMQTTFVRKMSETGDATESARRAGYRGSNAAAAAYDLMQLPHVLAALQIAVRRHLVTDAPMARRVTVEIAQNEDISPKVRLDAAKTLLDRAGHVAPRPRSEDDRTQTPLHEMTTDELRELATRLEGEIAGRAKEIAPTSSDVVDDVIG
jgi:phage terminase small subunit